MAFPTPECKYKNKGLNSHKDSREHNPPPKVFWLIAKECYRGESVQNVLVKLFK